MKYLLDSSAWIALINSQDRNHNAVLSEIAKHPLLMLIYPVFEEIVAVLHSRFGPAVARQSVDVLLSSESIEWVFLTKQQNKEICEQYIQAEPYIDYVDQALLYFSEKRLLPVLTFDKHFRQAGASTVLQ